MVGFTLDFSCVPSPGYLNDNFPVRLKLLILIRFVRNISFLDRHSGVSLMVEPNHSPIEEFLQVF